VEFEKSINEQRVLILRGGTKREVLLELVDTVSKSANIRDVEQLKNAIFYREELMSTGIGLGIAVPHVRIPEIEEPITAVGVSHEGIKDYESLDDQLIRVIVMIVAGKEQHKRYIKLLAEITSKLKSDDVLKKLLKAENSEEIYRILLGQENA
jgi:PTS system nitrogen regulatory IIA component